MKVFAHLTYSHHKSKHSELALSLSGKISFVSLFSLYHINSLGYKYVKIKILKSQAVSRVNIAHIRSFELIAYLGYQ